MNFTDFFYSLVNILNEMSPYILLGFLIAGILHAFVDASTMTRHLSGNGIKPVVKAALFGIPLPLCSCGVLPTAVSLRRQGASKAATTSFLIATPQTGVDSIAATYSLLGLPFAIIRPLAALVGAVGGGLAVGKFAPDATCCECAEPAATDTRRRTFGARVVESLRYGFIEMIASVGKWLVIGLVVAALVTVFVPDSLFVGLSKYPLLAMLAVVVVAIPMYICATGSIPIALSLMMKGLSPGIAFVMLMAGPAANFASVVILNRTQGRKATAIYIASVVITAITIGLVIDLLLPRAWFIPQTTAAETCCHVHLNIFDTVCSVILVALLLYSALRGRFSHKHKLETKENSDIMTRTYKVTGMNCSHCKATVEKAITALEGVTAVEINLSEGTVLVEGDVAPEKVIEAVHCAGFDCEA
ncbi:MAG: permease [Muribaculaceae bacterium]|nr:permease [Muribaculaceae bacterium]